MFGHKVIRLMRRALATGDAFQVVFDGVVPAGHEVANIIINLDATFTNDGAAAAIAATTYPAIIATAAVGKRQTGMTGRLWDLFDRLVNGANACLPPSIPATNAGVFQRNIRWVIPYRDPRSARPDDTCPDVGVLKGEPLDVRVGALATLFPHATVTGTFRIEAEVRPVTNVHPAAPLYYGYVNLSSLMVDLVLPKSGMFVTDLVIVKADGSAITSGEVATVQLDRDGDPIYQDRDLGELAAQFNRYVARGTGVQTLSDTAPVGGEALNDQKDPANGGTGLFSLPFVPAYHLPARYAAAYRLAVQRQLRATLTGTLVPANTPAVLAYRAVERLSESQRARASAKAGRGPVPASSAGIFAGSIRG